MSVQVIARIRPLLKTERECDVIVQPCSSSSSTALQSGNEALSKTKENEKPLKAKKIKNGKGEDADISLAKATVVRIPNPRNEGEDFSFKFHSVYDGTATQQDIFDAEGQLIYFLFCFLYPAGISVLLQFSTVYNTSLRKGWLELTAYPCELVIYSGAYS